MNVPVKIDRPGLLAASTYEDADETWEFADGRETAARVALWYREPRFLAGDRVGYVGGYVARDAAAGARILAHAFERLRAQGCTLAVGPIDGSTWRPYRFVTWSGGEPAFALEPTNPAAYVEQFERAGFAPIARYVSLFDTALDGIDPNAAPAVDALRAHGVVVRPFATHDPDRDLRALYDFSRKAFARNVLQTPIGFDAFAALYRPILRFIDPAFFLVAEHDAAMCGFAFALPDRTFDPAGPVLVIKTLARDPDPAFRGLGAVLAARLRRTAAAAGYRGSVSALIHEDNASRAIAEAYGGHAIRRYAVYAKRLK